MRRLKLLGLALAVLTAAMIAIPRNDPYAYLRPLHPKEGFRAHDWSFAGHPGQVKYSHLFAFQNPFDEVYGFLAGRGAIVGGHDMPLRSDGKRAGKILELANGKHAQLLDQTDGTVMDVWDEEPTWLQLRIQGIREFLHLS